jgi:hypothetical protein
MQTTDHEKDSKAPEAAMKLQDPLQENPLNPSNSSTSQPAPSSLPEALLEHGSNSSASAHSPPLPALNPPLYAQLGLPNQDALYADFKWRLLQKIAYESTEFQEQYIREAGREEMSEEIEEVMTRLKQEITTDILVAVTLKRMQQMRDEKAKQ